MRKARSIRGKLYKKQNTKFRIQNRIYIDYILYRYIELYYVFIQGVPE